MSAQTVESLVDELDDLCDQERLDGGQLSLAALRRKLAAIPSSALHGSPFFHRLCANKNVTREIVDYVFDAIPEAAHMSMDVHDEFGNSPVHLACRNEFCTHSVIQLLVEKNPAALGYLSFLGDGVDDDSYDDSYEDGLFPLQYYFMRNAHDLEPTIDLETVKMLVRACPEALAAERDEHRPHEFAVVPILLPLFRNPNVNKAVSSLSDIVQYIVSVSPNSIRSMTWRGKTPLHMACACRGIDAETMKILFRAWPESARLRDGEESLPIHHLCRGAWMNEDDLTECLFLLLEAHPQSAMEPDEHGKLPIHLAVKWRFPAFCEMLIEANPASLRVATDDEGHLPIHEALCSFKYIHQVGIIRLLLEKDPGCVSKATATRPYHLPLHLACYMDSKAHGVFIAKTLFDAFPEAICTRDGDGRNPLDYYGRYHRRKDSAVKPFLEAQIVFIREAQNNGDIFWLAIRALTANASLGTIKWLVKRDPSSLQEHDWNNSSLLHCACRKGNWKAVGYLLEARGSLAEERNADNKLPIYLLWECNDVDRNSPGYVEAVWKLLLANPTDILLGF